MQDSTPAVIRAPLIGQASPFLITLERLGRGDLDTKAREPDISARARRQDVDRRDSKVAQDLCPEPDFAPLDIALVLRTGAFLPDRRYRHARGALAQIDEDTSSGCLEVAQRGMDWLGAAEHIFKHVGSMEPRRHTLAVADAS